MNVGSMRLKEIQVDGKPFAGMGRVVTLQQSLKFGVRVYDGGRTGDNVPAFFLIGRNPAGEPIQIGAAWRKTSREPGTSPFYTLTFDDPSFDKPLYLTAFETPGDASTFDLVWRRPRRQEGGAGDGAHAPAPPAGAPDLDDEIPF